jgi:hypothetical protein
MPIDVDDWRAGRTPTCSCVRLVVTCVEIAIAFPIFWGIAVESADDAGQNTKLLTSVVSDNANLNADYSMSGLVFSRLFRSTKHTFGQVWTQIQSGDGHVLNLLRIKSQNAKVVDRISIYRVRVDLLVVIEYDVTPEWAGTNYMSVCQDITVIAC